MSSYERLKERYTAANQPHVFTYWDKLNEKERDELLQNLNKIDIERANRIFAKSIHASEGGNEQDSIEPLPDDAFDTTIGEENVANVASWRKIGLDAIGAGKVGVLLMAGGQGTRLGSSDPKGCYDIGLPSHKSLFQIQAERILRLQTVAEKELGKPEGSVIVSWYIMISGPTHPATVAFFEKHHYFGLPRSNVIFFEQGILPCFSPGGKVILASPTEIATAPDGNGGLYAGLRAPLSPSDPDHSVLSDLKSRGIEYIHAYAVDNCLVRVADPVFVGYSIEKQADCAAKVVPKAAPHEAVGVVALKGNAFSVVEYSEITKEQAERKDSKYPDRLAFRAANIANHFYTRTFLEEVESFESQLAFHIAHKKIPYCPVDNPTGETIRPSKSNGIKLELFVFDVFPFAKHMFVLEVERKEEFSPLKNAPGTGSDDPDTSRTDILAQQKRFLQRAGASVTEGVVIEISSLASYAGEGLDAVKGKTYIRSGFVGSVEELDALV
ncbi:nucleotide-diphospho-sugar transferase [Cantharellus anzutake]|uniref:nucleotide-diphospho-sugar transferase n=1 Tax=Cantharellus anzutake TaxID=1750568 RepID=UPI001904E78D|nr:nucleotide-diphospho-sugar transferase [Cantharellus anzutake]KAF8336561.1 nucleotide-diphospho-sugar transferase [Cantharellus anzutake]